MLKAIEGIFRDGKIELLEPPPDQKEARVLVTFLEGSEAIDLNARGISPAQALEHRAQLGAMVEDWDRPEMDVYDEPILFARVCPVGFPFRWVRNWLRDRAYASIQ